MPADEDPSATELGADRFLLGLLKKESEFVPVYQAGLDELVRMGFGGLEPAAQDAFLHGLERGEVGADWPVPGKRFFALLVQHTVEGVYSDPGNGGNRDGAAWRMVGYEVTA